MDITFTNITDFNGLEKPKPASQVIPEWYKKAESYKNNIKKPNGNGGTDATIKRCMPVFDAITAGYIITLPADVYVSLKNGQQMFEWSNFKLVDFHHIEQAQKHPLGKPYPYPKWMNPWAIRTPKGYSTLFTQPMHHDLPFTILPGIVDTDEYYAPVNFPFVINDPMFEGLIPFGTPIAQVIPFKRESWKMVLGGEKESQAHKEVTRKMQSKFFDRYKTMFRVNKEYK